MADASRPRPRLGASVGGGAGASVKGGVGVSVGTCRGRRGVQHKAYLLNASPSPAVDPWTLSVVLVVVVSPWPGVVVAAAVAAAVGAGVAAVVLFGAGAHANLPRLHSESEPSAWHHPLQHHGALAAHLLGSHDVHVSPHFLPAHGHSGKLYAMHCHVLSVRQTHVPFVTTLPQCKPLDSQDAAV